MSITFNSLPMGISYGTAIFILVFCIVIEQYWRSNYSNGRRYPPGPPTKLIVGNIVEVLERAAWFKFTEYKKKYGDLVFFHGLGNSVLVLNSLEATNDLLEGQASNYSHRPRFVVAGELIGINKGTPFLSYGEEWRAQRKLAHIALSPKAVQQYHPMLEDFAALFGELLLETPEDFFDHVRLTAGRIIMSITYGLSTSESADHDFIKLAEENMTRLSRAVVPGAFLCDLIPILQYAPSWVPFKKEAKRSRALNWEVLSKPFEYVKHEMNMGTARPSLAQDVLSANHSGDPAQLEQRVIWTMGSLYGAGSETTFATVVVCILALAMNPEKQRLAQAEIDKVVGERLPTVHDRPDLPYVNALIKETMRWQPVSPLGLARSSAEDAIYRGYLIPKSTVVVANIWAITHEPNEKYDPMAFIPERFLDPTQSIPDPASWVYGFARRICPGRFLAENSTFMLIATILAAFDVAAPPNEEIKPEFTSDFVSYPKPFKCIIKPRSDAKATFVKGRAAQSTL